MLDSNREVRFGCVMKAWERDKLHRMARAQKQRPGALIREYIKNAKITKNNSKPKKNPNMRRNYISPKKKEVSTPKQCPTDWMSNDPDD